MKNFLQGKFYLAFSVFALTFMVSCNNDDDDSPATPAKMTAAEFMNRAAQSDTFEITTGKMARDAARAATMRVMTFGDTIKMDHRKNTKELMALAAQKNITITPTMPEDKRVIVNRLMTETGTTFDKDFANIQVVAHEEAIALFTQASQEVEDADVKAFAQSKLPVLQMHLHHAHSLKTFVNK